MRVDAVDLAVDIGRHRIVHNGSLTARSGSLVGLIGPNGSGKSTLLRTVHRALAPAAGSIRIGDHEVWRLSARACARLTSVMLQDDTTDFDFGVREVVAIGRVPHQGALGRSTGADDAAVGEAMDTAGVGHLADRMLNTLSGGERQRVFLARALAQQTPVMVLDEPTNHLDIRAQFDLLELLVALPVTVVAALHDLDLAAAYCDEIHLMHRGSTVASGPPADVLTPARIREVYGVTAAITVNPLTGRPAVHLGPLATSRV